MVSNDVNSLVRSCLSFLKIRQSQEIITYLTDRFSQTLHLKLKMEIEQADNSTLQSHLYNPKQFYFTTMTRVTAQSFQSVQ